MNSFAATFKAEISRIARKEVKSQVQAIKKATTVLRTENAGLRKKLSILEKQVRLLNKGKPNPSAEPASPSPATQFRFSGARLLQRRTKWGLSAAQMGQLLHVSSATIYAWEQGRAQPRNRHFEKIAEVFDRSKKANLSILAGQIDQG